jgi:hypothetical protein
MTNRPVLAVTTNRPNPEGIGFQKVSKVLVATDFSGHSKRVVQYAFDLKRMFNASLYMPLNGRYGRDISQMAWIRCASGRGISW